MTQHGPGSQTRRYSPGGEGPRRPNPGTTYLAAALRNQVLIEGTRIQEA